jgi:HlyD family secretion protein
MDQYRFSRMALEAQVKLAEASVLQAQGNLENSKANVGYTEIASPVDGIVVDCKIDTGQTIAAQFQTPELFVVAPDMDKLMHVFAAVDEADIGLIRRAKERGLSVQFWVDAYPDDVFQGEIYQIRASSTTTQNVVTYPVVVAAPNTELKLLPGMTASLEFEVDSREEAVRVPNAALRYFPRPELVRKEDREIVQPTSGTQTADRRKRGGTRHVWVDDSGKLRAIQVRVGLSDSNHTELLEGDLQPGQKLVVGLDDPVK